MIHFICVITITLKTLFFLPSIDGWDNYQCHTTRKAWLLCWIWWQSSPLQTSEVQERILRVQNILSLSFCIMHAATTYSVVHSGTSLVLLIVKTQKEQLWTQLPKPTPERVPLQRVCETNGSLTLSPSKCLWCWSRSTHRVPLLDQSLRRIPTRYWTH